MDSRTYRNPQYEEMIHTAMLTFRALICTKIHGYLTLIIKLDRTLARGYTTGEKTISGACVTEVNTRSWREEYRHSFMISCF